MALIDPRETYHRRENGRSSLLLRTLDIYRRMFSRHPVLVGAFAAAYIGVVAYISGKELTTSYKDDLHTAEMRISELQSDLRASQRTVDILQTRGIGRASIRDLEFDDVFESEDTRASALRLLEYADYAMEKNDFGFAKIRYQEALELEDSLTARFKYGRALYVQGDLMGALEQWSRIAQRDVEGKYPDVRFYMAVSLHELSNEEAALEVLKQYVELRSSGD